MNSNGDIRFLADGEQPQPGELMLTQKQYNLLHDRPKAERKQAYEDLSTGGSIKLLGGRLKFKT